MKNPYIRDFRTQLGMRFSLDSEKMSYSDWILQNTTLRKKRFSFKDFEFQRDIVDDMHTNMYVIKCSQIGLTEVQQRKFAAFLARNTGVNGIFTLPDDNMFKRVSQTRFKPMLENDKVFNLDSGLDSKPIRSIPLYQIGLSFGYFVGNKESDATSINADLLFHDELDLSDQEMIALFQSRLQGSDWRITQNFSTPTYEGFGIDAGYKISDQHEYMCKCEKCNHWNIPEFTPKFVTLPGLRLDVADFIEIDDELADGIDMGKVAVRCEKCGTPLNFGNPELRQWVARFPGRRVRGYQVSPFATPRLTVPYIIEQMLKHKRANTIRRFYNTVLGKAHNDNNARLSELEIRAIMSEVGHLGMSDMAPVFVGVDVGQTCHVVLYADLAEKPVAFSWRQVASENLADEIKKINTQYNLVGGAIDRYPYTPLSNEIRDITNGRIMPFEYATVHNAAPVQIIKDELDNISHIRINRTTAIDGLATAIRKRKIVFTGCGQFENLIVQHLRDMVRIEKDDLSAMWQKLTGEDHFFHAATLGLYSIRVMGALHYHSEADHRQLMMAAPMDVAMGGNAGLGLKSLQKAGQGLLSGLQ